MRVLWWVLAYGLMAQSAWAQLEDSIVVTGSRIDVRDDMPGTVLKRNGDYLLLPVTIVNDSRLEDQRHDEIYKTLRKLLDSAKRNGIEIGVIVDERFIRPLTGDDYKIPLVENERRPDTSRATIRVSAPLKQSSDPGKQIARLRSFVEDASVVGRTELVFEEDVEVSLLDPGQYRNEIIRLVAEDIKRVTASLGPDYRIRLEAIDRQVKWVRSGLSEVTLYIPYAYEVLPAADAYFINKTRYE